MFRNTRNNLGAPIAPSAPPGLCGRALRPGALVLLTLPPRENRPRYICLDCASKDHYVLGCGIGAGVVIPLERDRVLVRTCELHLYREAARDARILLDAVRSARKKHAHALTQVLPRLLEESGGRGRQQRRHAALPSRVVPVALEKVVASGRAKVSEAVAVAITTGAGRHGVWGLSPRDVEQAVYERLIFELDKAPFSMAKEIVGAEAARQLLRDLSTDESDRAKSPLPILPPRHVDPARPMPTERPTCEAPTGVAS